VALGEAVRRPRPRAAAKVVDRLQHPLCSSGLYVALGWLALVTIGPMVEPIATGGLVLIVGGGVADTVGALCFLIEARTR
jgi:hemolysin III